jgi:serine protease inhibitor
MRCKHNLLAPVIAAALLGAASPCALAAPGSVDMAAAADNAFGFRLLNAVQKTTPRSNVVLSPVSASLNLSMVLNGADGETRQEMLTALSLSGSDIAAINADNAELIKTLRTPTNNVTLSVADSLWSDSRRAMLRPDYVKQMQTWYDAEVVNLDFSSPGAVPRINTWAARETHDRIPQVIDRIDPTEVALLINAVYFKGQWTRKFDKAQTRQRDFTLADGSVKQLPRMAQSGRFDYFETPDMQAIRLPFGTGDLVMDVLLPAKSSSLGALQAQLTPEHWADWSKRLRPRPGAIELPRFELKSRYRLNGALHELGMRRAFSPQQAHLAGLFSPESQHAGPFFISMVLQSTYWKTDEEGSEAAAVTTTTIRAAAVARPESPFQMVVDRPFFCAIEDRRSGALLFVGTIYDPAG